MQNNKIAVKAFERLQNSIVTAHGVAEYFDSMFDSGEFSGPAHSSAMEREIDAICAHVATRFAIHPDNLYNDWQYYCCHQMNIEMDLIMSGKMKGF